MDKKRICNVEGCKANMEHRLGHHSWWCSNYKADSDDEQKVRT